MPVDWLTCLAWLLHCSVVCHCSLLVMEAQGLLLFRCCGGNTCHIAMPSIENLVVVRACSSSIAACYGCTDALLG